MPMVQAGLADALPRSGAARAAAEAGGEHLLLAKSERHGIVGAWLLQPESDAVAAPQVWQMCQMASPPGLVAMDDERAGALAGPIARRLLAEALRFALRQGIDRYVLVASSQAVQLLLRQGLPAHCVAPVDGTAGAAVVCRIQVEPNTLRALGVADDGNPAAIGFAEPGHPVVALSFTHALSVRAVLQRLAAAGRALIASSGASKRH